MDLDEKRIEGMNISASIHAIGKLDDAYLVDACLKMFAEGLAEEFSLEETHQGDGV